MEIFGEEVEILQEHHQTKINQSKQDTVRMKNGKSLPPRSVKQFTKQESKMRTRHQRIESARSVGLLSHHLLGVNPPNPQMRM